MKFPKPDRRKKRTRTTKDGRVILSKSQLSALRVRKWELAGGCCEMCGKPASLEYGQLCHYPPKKMGNGFGSDTLETTLWGCRECHDALDNRNQKVVPAK